MLRATWLENQICPANHMERLAITPTTAAVMPASARASQAIDISFSRCGAKRKIHKKQGRNVTQSVRRPAIKAKESPPA